LDAGEFLEGAGRLEVRQRRGNVYAVGVVDPAEDVGDGDDLVARLVQESRADAADVPRPLDDDAGGRRRELEAFGGLVEDEQEAAPRGLAPPARAAQLDRLAGDDGVDGVAGMHG